MTNDRRVGLLRAVIPNAAFQTPNFSDALAHSTTTAGSDVAGRVAGQFTFERRERMGRKPLGQT